MTAEPINDPVDQESVAMRALANAGDDGLTFVELGGLFGWHHGQSSAVLSTLHKAERIVRLVSGKRLGNSVYVTPEYRAGRPSVKQGRVKPIDDYLERMLTSFASDGRCLAMTGEQGRDDEGPNARAMFKFIQDLRVIAGYADGPFTKAKT